MQLGLQQDMPDVPPPWVDASDLLLQAERLTLSPPPAACIGGVRTLQELVCAFLARHLHTLALLDDLPEHLAATVRDSIRRDRSLLGDDGLGVWLDAVLETGDTRQLSLRWAQGLTDSGLGQLRSRAEWASTLVALDLGYCESISDEGVVLLCAQLRSLRTLSLCGCMRCGDGSAAALGRHCPALTSLNLELLTKLTDIGVQAAAVVRGCGRLAELLLGGCHRLSNISTSLISDHLGGTLNRLGLGGLVSICDVDLEDVGKCRGLEWLELRALHRVSDAGVKQVGLLLGRQAKARRLWSAGGNGADGAGATPPPPALTHLDLGGLTRISDEALLKLAARAPHLVSLDLRGCTRLTPSGLTTAVVARTIDGVSSSADLPMPCLRELTLTACPAASAAALEILREARPGLALVTS